MRRNKSAIVIGGSLSGLLAALLLQRSGWTVEVFERVEKELAGRGAGIVAQPELIERLRDLGLDPADLGVHVTIRKLFDAEGRLVEETTCPQVLTAWERVYRLLHDAFPAQHYHQGKGLKGFTQSPDSITAHFHDGSSMQAELLVAADGIRSTVRQQVAPEVMPAYAGYCAWRSLLAEADMSPQTRADIFGVMAFGLPRGEQFLGYPVAGPDNDLTPGRRRYNVIWYRPADEILKLPWLLTDTTGVTHSISIPPPLIRAEAVAEMRAAAERLLAPQFREIVRLMNEPILQPIYDLETPHMAYGRVAIIGDAAFVARPHVGAGVAKAADDAAVLVESLRTMDSVDAALRQFEAARLPVGCRILVEARHLGAYLQASRTAEEEIKSAKHSIPQAVLAETARIDFLHEPF